MYETLRYLLFQVRNPDDPMRQHEIEVFARALRCATTDQIRVVDLIKGNPLDRHVEDADAVLLGGSGDYSVASGGPWLERALDAMRELHAISKPTFASCWGFQAMARAMGGTVVHDLGRAELGVFPFELTDAGQRDPVFSVLCETNAQPPLAAMGHEDIVDVLPPDAIRLASTSRTLNQAFTFPDKPIYCTQFHPELDAQGLLDRVGAYPKYVKKISGVPLDEFIATLGTTRGVDRLLARFVDVVFGSRGPVRHR